MTEKDLEFVVENVGNFIEGKDYFRNKTQDRIYERYLRDGIVFDDRLQGGWVLSEEKDILKFRHKKHLKELSEKYHSELSPHVLMP